MQTKLLYYEIKYALTIEYMIEDGEGNYLKDLISEKIIN